MDFLLIVPFYTRWHYSRGTRDLIHNWFGFVHFLTEFFSLGLLFHTLFAPWERMGEGYSGGFRLGEMASTFVVNSIMRVFGFFIRSAVLIAGFLCIVLAMLVGLLSLIFWVCFPFIIFFFLALSAHYFF